MEQNMQQMMQPSWWQQML